MKFFTASLITAAVATNGSCGTAGCSGATPVCVVSSNFDASPSVVKKCKNKTGDQCPTLAATGDAAANKAKLAQECALPKNYHCKLASDKNSCPETAITEACKCVANPTTGAKKDTTKKDTTKKDKKKSSATRNLALAGLALVGLVTV